jgi:hypothetical protein
MLIYTAELLYHQGEGAQKSTKRIGKVMVMYSKMFVSISDFSKKQEKHKFLMGSLYALGGLLKVEAKSYLITMREKDAEFSLPCLVSNPENAADEQEKQFIKQLSDDDLEYFHSEFSKIMINFCESVCEGL